MPSQGRGRFPYPRGMQGPPGYPPPYGHPNAPPMMQQPQGYPGQAPYPGPPPMQPGMPGMGMAPGRRAAPVTMNGTTYVVLYVVCTLATGGLSALAADPKTTEAAPFVPLPLLVLAIAQMVALYKMWSAIDDGQTKPTPGMAIGLLFVPLFSLYWIFVVWPGYAGKYNAYIQRHGIQAPPLGMGLILASILLSWVPIVGIVLMAISLSKICKAVNALSAPPMQQGMPPMGYPQMR